MKIFRQITSNWDENQVEILRQHHIKVEMGINRFNIYDLGLYTELKPLFIKWGVLFDFLSTDFSKKEVSSAEYVIINRWNDYGYPMPDNDGSYLYYTYETKDMCRTCGVGKVQKDDFRVRKTSKHPIWGVGWIYDEFFVRVDLYEKIFKPLGIACRPLRKYKDGSVIESFVQLVLPVIDEPLELSYYESLTCPECGETKYDAMTCGYYPLQEHPLPFIYKSKEFFGSGFSANRKIFVSAYLRDLMIEKGMMKHQNFVPCAKAEELGIRNLGLMEWSKNVKRMGFDASNINKAITD